MAKPKQPPLKVERLGGVVGFGVGHLKSRGEVAWSALSVAERALLERHFADATRESETPKGVEERYRITQQTPMGPRSITLPFGETPATLRNSVIDALE